MHIIDWMLVVVYMIFMVVIGAYFKTSDSMEDFAVADKKARPLSADSYVPGDGSRRRRPTGSTGNGFAAGIMEITKLLVLFGINIFMALFLAKKMRNIGGSQLLKCSAGFTGKNARLSAGCSAQYIRWEAAPPCSRSPSGRAFTSCSVWR